MSRFNLGCHVVFVIFVYCAALCADGKQDADAKVQFRQGIALFQEEKFEQAVISFERAYELRPSYKILWNIAQTENLLGHYAAAMSGYIQYLKEGGDEVPDERVKSSRKEIKRLSSLIGTLKVVCAVDGADIKVDHEVIGTTPLTEDLFVDLGRHEVEVLKGSEVLFKEVVKIAGGGIREIQIETEGPPSATQSTEAVEPPEPSPAPKNKPKRLVAWILLGVGGASAIAAGITGGLSISKVNTIKDGCTGNTCPKRLKADRDQARTLGILSTVYTAAAGTFLATGIVLLFLRPGLKKERQDAVLLPSMSPGSVGLQITGRF